MEAGNDVGTDDPAARAVPAGPEAAVPLLRQCFAVPATRYILLGIPILAAVDVGLGETKNPVEARSFLLLAVEIFCGCCLIVAVVRFRPAARKPWLMLSVGQVFITASSASFYLGGSRNAASQAISALGSLAHVAMSGGALLYWIIHDRNRRDPVAGIDVGIIFVVAALLSWVLVLSPIISRPDAPIALKVVAALLPLSDLIVLSLAVRMLFVVHRPSPALFLFFVYILCWLVGNASVLVGVARNDSDPSDYNAPMQIMALMILAAAALNPSMVAISGSAGVSKSVPIHRRVSMVGLAMLVPPSVLLVEYFSGGPRYVLSAAAAGVAISVLVMTRFSLLVKGQRNLAITDALTGLRTRRFFDEALGELIDQLEARPTETGILLIDIDHFKRVNDAYGHLVGDSVLKEVARRLDESLRSDDVIARFGGEEFAVLLPRTGPAEAVRLGERVRQAVAGTPFALDSGISLPITVSIGTASSTESRGSQRELVLTADKRLYEAKAGGRNCLVSGVH